jgi:hypothetical protein
MIEDGTWTKKLGIRKIMSKKLYVGGDTTSPKSLNCGGKFGFTTSYESTL